MASKRVIIAPVQQIVPIPQNAKVRIDARCEFSYAFATKEEVDDNKFKFLESSRGVAELTNTTASFLLLKTDSGECEGVISVAQLPTPPAKKGSFPIAIVWAILIALVLFFISRKRR